MSSVSLAFLWPRKLCTALIDTSADINTELGVVIDSPEIAGPLYDALYAAAPRACYEPFLDEKGRLRWRVRNNGQVEILTHEPDTGYFHRVGANLGRMLPIRGQL